MAELEEIYRQLREGRRSARAASAIAAPKPAPRPPLLLGLYLDGAVKSLLQDAAKSKAAAPGYSNAELASELLQAEHITLGKPVPNRAILQRLALAGKLFALVAQDPALPDSFKQGFERLRFPLIKSALADSDFFTQNAHPLRGVVAEFLRKAAEARFDGAGAERSLEELLRGAAGHFDLAAGFVRPALAKLKPLSNEAIEEFLSQLEAGQQERQTGRERRAQQIVRRAIDARVLTTPLPRLIRFLLEEEWSLVLARRLLQDGVDGPRYREGLKLVDDLLEQVPAATEGAPLPDDLLKRMEAGVAEIRDKDSAGPPILQGLRRLANWLVSRSSRKPGQAPTPAEQASVEVATTTEPTATEKPPPASSAAEEMQAPAAPAPPSTPALDALMRAGRWFRVFDHRQQAVRWLKLEAYYPQQGSMVFAEFDGANPLGVQAREFLEDLRLGRSAPANPDAETRALLAQLVPGSPPPNV